MNRFILTAVPLLLLALWAFSGNAFADGAREAVNSVCPISKEVIDGKTFLDLGGKTIGFCCPGCVKPFEVWTQERQEAFVASSEAAPVKDAQSATQPSDKGAAQLESVKWSEPYSLSKCVISGQPLGSMGDPVVKSYAGREVRFCCAGCIGGFEDDVPGNLAKIDAMIVEDQMPFYPLDTCVVTGESLSGNGSKSHDIVYGNRLVRLCCKRCEKTFKEKPQGFIKKLDEAVAAAQRADYPLDTCVVAGGKLGSMGEPSEMIIGGRLLRFCCAGCHPTVSDSPMTYLAMVDKAWHARRRFKRSGTTAAQPEGD